MSEPTEESPRSPGRGASPRRRRGRPVGSVSLTPEIQQTILTYIRAGAFVHVAAVAAGISARTLQDWLSRGEGTHPSRPATPKLKAFAKAVRQAQAEARIAAEVSVHQQSPRYWLSHVARSRLGEEGWTEPVEPPGEHSPEQRLVDLIRRLDERDRQEADALEAPQVPTTD